MITAIEKHFPNVSEINIFAIDGNNEASNIFKQIIDKVQNQSTKIISLKILHFVFDRISDFSIKNIINQNFEFILSFKFICEIISMGKGNLDNSIYHFVKKFLPLLSENGLCILLDITTKPKHTTYYPILMNKQVNQALKELNKYTTLIPIPCGVYGEICFCDCFTQKIFFVTHSKRSKDKSRVTYRVLLSRLLKEKMNYKFNSAKQLINNEKICSFTENGKLTMDSYFLSSYI